MPDSIPPPFPASLCHRCRHKRDVTTERAWFLRCAAPDLPKYAPQPVLACPRFEAPDDAAPRG